MKFSKKEIETLRSILEKIEGRQKLEKIRISGRRKSQLKGKTLYRKIQKRKKPVRQKRRVTKKRSSIR